MTDDMISRQAALDVLHGYFDGMLETDTICPKDLYNEIEALPSTQPVEDIRAMCGECDAWNQYKNYPHPGWIPCSAQLPKLGTRYNVTYESGEVGYADFRNKVIYGDKCIENVWNIPEYYEDDGQVVAWMPLPIPWRDEKL